MAKKVVFACVCIFFFVPLQTNYVHAAELCINQLTK